MFEVIKHPTTTSPEFHRTSIKKINSNPWEELHFIKDTLVYIITNIHKQKRYGVH